MNDAMDYKIDERTATRLYFNHLRKIREEDGLVAAVLHELRATTESIIHNATMLLVSPITVGYLAYLKHNERPEMPMTDAFKGVMGAINSERYSLILGHTADDFGLYTCSGCRALKK